MDEVIQVEGTHGCEVCHARIAQDDVSPITLSETRRGSDGSVHEYRWVGGFLRSSHWCVDHAPRPMSDEEVAAVERRYYARCGQR